MDDFEERQGKLEADNARLHQRLATVDAEKRELTDSLDAARLANRDLMNEINRSS